MPKPLVIVESPAKAKTIAGFLGAGYAVESSIGHIRDLPRKAQEVPAAYKDEPWAKRWGVDVDNDFKPLYVVPAEKKAQVAKLKALLKDADEVYLATDEDREGEAIAWHLLEVLSPRVPVRRMVFHEITKAAIRRPSTTGGTSTASWSTPRRPAGSSTASSGGTSPRSCGRRSPPGCRPAGCRASPPGSWWSGSGAAWRSVRPATGTWRRPSRPRA